MTPSDKCYNGGKRITVTSNKQLWELEEADEKDYAMEIKVLTVSALERHKANASNNEKECRLDYTLKDGVLPQTDTIWRFLWGYVENEIRKFLMKKKRTPMQRKRVIKPGQ